MTSGGKYLQLYASTLEGASRMEKYALSLHPHIGASATELVGIQTPELPHVDELAPGVSTVRVRGVARRGNLGRALRLVLWQPRVYRHYAGQQLRAVAAHNVWLLPLCARLAHRADAALIYNAHELETESIAMDGLKQWLAKLIERRYIKRCALVSVVNDPIADWYAAEYSIPRPIPVRNIPVDSGAEVDVRTDLGIHPDEMLYIHTGHLSDARNIPLILDAFSKKSHLHVLFMGSGPLLTDVLRYAGQYPNIHWIPPVSTSQIVPHVRDADVGLCLIDTSRGLSVKLSTPNKLMEALAADRPALCSDLVEARLLLGDLGDDWVLEQPVTQLSDALDAITKETVAEFRQRWNGMPTWESELSPLVAAYRTALEAHHRQRQKGPAGSVT